MLSACVSLRASLAALLLATSASTSAAATVSSLSPERVAPGASRTLLGKPSRGKPAGPPPGQANKPPSSPPGQQDKTSPQDTKPKNGECIVYTSSSTTDNAVDAWTELMIDLQKFYCTGVSDPTTMVKAFDGRITAIAELLLSVRLICKAQGNKMLACGQGWTDAHSFASASYDAWVAAYAQTGTKGECTCGQELFADAAATVNAWAEVWADIYATLDVVACVSGTKQDQDPARIDLTATKECTATVIASYWGKIMAQTWLESDCVNNEPPACIECCTDEWGVSITGCDCDAWKQECSQAVTSNTKATALAWVDTKTETNTATCTLTVTEKVKKVTNVVAVKDVKPDENNNAVYGSGDVGATCEAFAAASSKASAVSEQADAVKGFMLDTCSLSHDAEPLKDRMAVMSQAIASVYNEAFSECKVSGDATDTAACAISTSFSESFASACAAATADAWAGIDAKSCDCDVSAWLSVDAWTQVYKRIFAHAEQQVEAWACDFGKGGTTTAEIRRECTVNSIARTLAQAIADVSMQASCAAPDSEWCESECAAKGVSATEADWSNCITTCKSHSKLEATAVVDAIASIDVGTSFKCTNNVDIIGDCYVTAQTLSGAK